MTGEISPPPSKRRRIVPTQTTKLPGPPSPPPPPSPGCLRIYAWNINGIAPFLPQKNPITKYFQPKAGPARSNTEKPPRAEPSLRAFLSRHHWPGILFLQEVKISDSDIETQNAVRLAVNARLPSGRGEDEGPRYKIHFTLPTDRKNARGLAGTGKVYGVCSIVRSDIYRLFNLSCRFRTVDWDKEGRVSIVELTSPPESCSSTKIAIFNIYAVNGTESPYRDPRTGAVMGTRHDRKLAFHRLLVEECISLEENGWNVVMAGDFNIAPARMDGYPNLRTFPCQHVFNRADFIFKFLGKGEPKTGQEAKQWHGVDIWRAMNPDVRRFTYYPRTRQWGISCDRVDYFLISKKLWDGGRVGGAGMLDSEEERGPSDHVPIWADIQILTPTEEFAPGE
ncbi:DNase I-like protein [Westerdykella ornata]|uniref:DNase I-like protein n=1 Tax=Westerdykella ornata TaxID=318751 RepID=A0A6A6JW54_WESOR|nr:DNase I-like protein [Westerdykella ornata]KAF2280637.1 DNase I-like protein [Westerdykella ornata]